MHVISRRRLKEAAERHADLGIPLEIWYKTAKTAEWKSIDDVRKTYASADGVGELTIFNIKGNSYRLIVKIEYQWQKVFIKEVLTHAEYDKGDWKKWALVR